MKLRDATEEDLKDFTFNEEAICAVCDLSDIITVGAYRLSEWYSCKECCLEKMQIEEDEDGN